MLAIEIAACSERGGRTSNEDAWTAGRIDSTWLAVLADGAGGHARGAEAAQQVVAHVATALQASATGFGPPALSGALHAAHVALQAAQPGATGRDRMHATVVVLWLDARAERALWAHVGDSRLYCVRRGHGELLTADDSVVQRLQASGALTSDQAAGHPMRHQLLAAMGMQEAIDPHCPPEPAPLHDGDAFLLCSDGWWGLLEDADIAGTLFDAASPRAWLQAMQALIAARAPLGHDNFSAVAVWVADPAETTQEPGDEESTVIEPRSD